MRRGSGCCFLATRVAGGPHDVADAHGTGVLSVPILLNAHSYLVLPALPPCSGMDCARWT